MKILIKRISEKYFIFGGLSVILIYVILIIYALFSADRNMKIIRKQNINDTGNVYKELVKHEFHNLLEVPNQIIFIIENYGNSEKYIENNTSSFKLILQKNPIYHNFLIISPHKTKIQVKGNYPNSIIDEQFQNNSNIEIVPNHFLRIKNKTKNGYFVVYDISLDYFHHHLKENQLSFGQELLIKLSNEQILFSPEKENIGLKNQNNDSDWKGQIVLGNEKLNLFLNLSSNFLLKNNERISKFLYIISISAFLILILLYIFYLKSIKNEQDKSKKLSQQNQQLLLENEKKLKENALLQLQQIKQQINPHFLFNSLNSLKSLIDFDAQLSQKFVLKLSNVYRYLLKNQDDGLVSIHQELDFVKEYYFLQKIRFGNALELEIISTNRNENKIPFLALQTLIENAIKHNVISKNEPLKIKIDVKLDSLEVTNLINKRNKVEENSMGIGLKYVENIYKFYHQNGFKYFESDGYFNVTLPFIKSNE